MIPVLQTWLEPPEADCFMACIASVTELPLEGLPKLHEAEGDGKNWWAVTKAALLEKGWLIINHNVNRPEDQIKPHGVAIAGGDSPRGACHEDGSNIGHAVVMSDGMLFHDPFPDGGGLDGDPDVWYFLIKLIKEQSDD